MSLMSLCYPIDRLIYDAAGCSLWNLQPNVFVGFRKRPEPHMLQIMMSAAENAEIGGDKLPRS
jgi:hypothetical protein